MSPQIKDIICSLNSHAPFGLAEPWDNVGLLIGHPEREVTSLLIGLDPTSTLIDEAITIGADTLITHHPLIFQPISAINTTTPAGRVIEIALRQGINVIACHTNLDSAENGVSDALARALGLANLSPLTTNPRANLPEQQGMGRIGSYPEGISSSAFLKHLRQALGLEAVHIAGRFPDIIKKVAICGGSGSDLAGIALEKGADIFLTAEIKHHIARWAEESNFCLIEGTHYATERLAIGLLADFMQTEKTSRNWNISITQTQTESHPFVLTYFE